MPNGDPASGSPPELVQPSENNSQDNKDKENQLLVYHCVTNLKKGRAYEIELLSRYETISGHQKNMFKILKHFYINGCSFAKDIYRTLNINKQTAYSNIAKLEAAGFIEPITRTNVPRRNGPKTTLYGIMDVTKEEIDHAISRDMNYSSKSYAWVEQLYQRTLPEIERESIQFTKIVSLAKRQGGKGGFHFMDLARHVEKKHVREGITVWRNS